MYPYIYHNIVGFDACHNAFKAFALLTHRQMIVHATNEVLHTVYHSVHSLDLLHIIHMFPDGCE